MGCTNCSCGSSGTACGSNGGCSTGSCNKLNTYDWLAGVPLPSFEDYKIIEVSFKKGARKDFYRIQDNLHLNMGDHVAVTSSSNGYDIGQVSLMGELVKIRLKKTKKLDEKLLPTVLRLANERDVEKLQEARLAERDVMVRARVIVRELGLEMKIGDVEFQGDKRKVTFYYTAEGRIDFRELIRIYAREFKVKIEMRQIGARQESARIGGIGSCGRELCCSTWLTEFKSVSTVAARYQNLAINQTKLSGQCGRLKCCLNYELDTYAEAIQDFPKHADTIVSKKGKANLLKTDIFKRLMFYIFKTDAGSTEIFQLSVDRVKELIKLANSGTPAETFKPSLNSAESNDSDENVDYDFVDVTGIIKLNELDKHKKKGRPKRRNKPRNKQPRGNKTTPNTDNNKNDNKGGNEQTPAKQNQDGTLNKDSGPNKNTNRRRRKPNRKKGTNPNQNNQAKTNQPEQQQQQKNTGEKTTNPKRNNKRNVRRKRNPQNNKNNPPKTD